MALAHCGITVRKPSSENFWLQSVLEPASNSVAGLAYKKGTKCTTKHTMLWLVEGGKK